ncbi:Glycosyltransferase, GT2 family [Salegentibacter echinorum]|uniref:Glycosyltransferase, GT2 family n=1 Tax=Salegentibacter echinorum TaxID=1073325 RepID=A0A1M5LLB8_SALEC|nr:glycosyltransferase [Salegentibacter echinorum]SHG65934.1 Glycosyltransferase, GT2 family [Salegentibacter echinorum]
MKFSLIICTYQRPQALLKLLNSVLQQYLYPDEVLIIDGSKDDLTKNAVEKFSLRNGKYFKVSESERGLTKQRNSGIAKSAKDIDIICFLDDDTVLEPNYFENLIATYKDFPNAVGVGGYIKNEVEWRRSKEPVKFDEFKMDGWVRKLGSRNLLRKRLNLLSDQPPGIMPGFSHGLSINFLPPSGKTYPVEFFMGGVASYKRELLEQLSFSNYFEGYGLYEDMDFCLRASRKGQLYVNTAAQLKHEHDESGRPNRFKYGKMVLRNGWYVWRIKYPKPSFKNRLKWHGTAFLLTLVRLGNSLNSAEREQAFSETLGRIAGWWSLILNKPKI